MEPLAGVRILDLGWYAPGPFCTLVCVCLGADVVKIEPPGGDPLRTIDAAAFEKLNAGKRSVRLDLKRDEGRDLFLELAKSADVVVEGFRPGVADRLRIGYQDVKRSAPSILYLAISGYGARGPYRDRSGHDVNYLALAGALSGAVAAPLPIQVADFAAGGLYGVTGILAALLERERTGEGRLLDLSMYHGVRAMSALATGEAGERLSGRYANYTVYETRDGRVLAVGALEEKFWRRFCRAIERDDLVARSDEPGTREEVARVVAGRDLAEWEERFRTVDACVEPVLTPGEAREHPLSFDRADLASAPWPFGGEPAATPGPAPALGEHTDALLSESGTSSEALAALRAKGVC